MASAGQLHPELEVGDVLLGDRAFCSFFHVVLLVSQGIHGIFRAHQKLIVDFTPGRAHAHPRRGKNASRKGLPRSKWIRSCGRQDQIVEWFKPVNVPNWMPTAAFAAAPETIRVRELKYRVARPGFRVREVTLVTTLCDEVVYSAADLAAAYGLRWTIRAIAP